MASHGFLLYDWCVAADIQRNQPKPMCSSGLRGILDHSPTKQTGMELSFLSCREWENKELATNMVRVHYSRALQIHQSVLLVR